MILMIQLYSLTIRQKNLNLKQFTTYLEWISCWVHLEKVKAGHFEENCTWGPTMDCRGATDRRTCLFAWDWCRMGRSASFSPAGRPPRPNPNRKFSSKLHTPFLVFSRKRSTTVKKVKRQCGPTLRVETGRARKKPTICLCREIEIFQTVSGCSNNDDFHKSSRF